ncbi:lipopolysaccharide biosynthesis protein [Mycolicibacterium wolinskyi]|uniref:lipopolysaccharide biosynthesis protein n=1 Tax=Mycolicibacterium wolinskyi TaxID=59750 RepID=UPI000DA20894|nr:lipopolysaccharide biosynthesis protein [Mycolicibacterium wolinskyi]
MGLKQQYSWILAGRLTGAAVQAASLTLVARWSGPAEFGFFAAAYGIALVTQTVADLGLTKYIVQLRVSDRSDGGIGAALRLGRNISIISTVVGTVALVAVGTQIPAVMALCLMPLWMSSEKQVEAWLGVSLADGKLWHNATSLVFRRLGALVVLLVAHAAGLDPVPSYLVGLTLFSLLAWWHVRIVTDDVRTDRTVRAKSLLVGGRHYWFNSLAVQAMNFDVTVVAAMASAQSAGYYAAASRLTTPLRIVPTSFATLLFPAAAKAQLSGARPLLKAVGGLIAITTVMYIGLAVALPILVPLVLGPSFDPAAPVIQVVCVGLIFAAITSQFNSLMQGWGYLRAVTIISTASTLLSLIAIAIAAAHWGALGAGFALAGGYVVQLAIQAVTIGSILRKQGRQWAEQPSSASLQPK